MGVYKGLKGSFLLYLLSCRFGGEGLEVEGVSGGERRRGQVLEVMAELIC